MKSTAQANKVLVERTFDALDNRDRDTFVDLHAEDAVMHSRGNEVKGIDAITEAEFAYFDAFPDLSMTIEELHAAEDVIAGRWQVTGTHEGEFRGIEATGKTVEFSTIGLFRIKADRISEVWIESDQLGLLEQLGAVEPLTE